MDICSGVIRQASNIFNQIQDCSILNTTITYRKYNGQIFDENVGANKDQYVESSLEGIETFHTSESAKASKSGKVQSEVQEGDRLFIFFTNIPIGSSLKDQIKTSDNNIYNVKAILDVRGFATLVTIDS